MRQKKFFKFLDTNKRLIVFLFLLFFVLVYCHLQTFIISDDLPYSLFFRGSQRITNIRQVVVNQLHDYSGVNARIFLHMIVQALLIFEKRLWSILNPLVIIINICLMSYILFKYVKTKGRFIDIVAMSSVMFLLLYNYKNLIYWVAGSVNYVWVFTILLLLIIYYFKYSLIDKFFISFVICLFSSMLCEVIGVFVIVTLVIDLLINIFLYKKEKKIIFKYIILLIGAGTGFSFIMFAPSTLGRFKLAPDYWKQLSFLGKLNLSVPKISDLLFNVFNIYNIFPIILTISIAFRLNKYNKEHGLLKWFVCSSSFSLLLFLIFKSQWLCLLYAVLLFVFQLIIFYKNKDYKFISLLFASYAICYSVAITSEYTVCRPGFHTSLFMGMFIIYNLIFNCKLNNIVKGITFCLLFITLIMEIVIYSYIGSVKFEREKSIKEVQSGKSNIVKTKKIKAPFDKFHMDPNCPYDNDYWAIDAFIKYYHLNDDIVVVEVE